MVSAWGGYSNGQIPTSAMVQIQGEWFEPDMAARMKWLLDECARQGVNIKINEGYRPLGVPADRYIRNESQTSTAGPPLFHGSNQYFQLGRADRGETPSAGTPGTSSHGWGKAADINPGRNNPVVAAACAKMGLIFTVPSESWHIAADGTPTVPYTPVSTRRKSMFIIQLNTTGAAFLVGPQFIHHIPSPAELTQLVEVYGEARWKNQENITIYLKNLGIPLDKQAAVMGGKTWSREIEILDALAKGGVTPSPAPSVDVKAIAKAVDDALKDDFAAIPKNVNDDAAKRMSS